MCSRCHCANSKLVTVELVKAYSLPVLLYAVEFTSLPRQVDQMLDKCIIRLLGEFSKCSLPSGKLCYH